MIETEKQSLEFSPAELDQFQREGFVVQRQLVSETYVSTIRNVTCRDAEAHFGDIEYEADVQYPGAPTSFDDEGGRTIRRLKQAFSRDPVFSRLVKEPRLLKRLQQLLGQKIVMPLAHHNCIMTKHPNYSSDTGWHQDTRYWSFANDELINAWIALGDENLSNGCLQLLPGSHRWNLATEQQDAKLFFREDYPPNQQYLDTAVTAELSAGDVLFFHARCFHSATRNYSTETKYSAVFTFRNLDNQPLPQTRSSSLPELLL